MWRIIVFHLQIHLWIVVYLYHCDFSPRLVCTRRISIPERTFYFLCCLRLFIFFPTHSLICSISLASALKFAWIALEICFFFFRWYILDVTVLVVFSLYTKYRVCPNQRWLYSRSVRNSRRKRHVDTLPFEKENIQIT